MWYADGWMVDAGHRRHGRKRVTAHRALFAFFAFFHFSFDPLEPPAAVFRRQAVLLPQIQFAVFLQLELLFQNLVILPIEILVALLGEKSSP